MRTGTATTLTERDYERAAEEYLRGLPPEHFMEATPQGTQRRITLASFDLLHALRPNTYLFNELLVQYPWEDGIGQVVPDNMVVVSDEPPRDMGSFNVPFESPRPLMVLEYISPYSKRKDYKESFQKYERQLRVPYCLLFYPERRDLRVFRHTGSGYERLAPNAAGRYDIPDLDLEVVLLDGWVRFWHQGNLLELPGELRQTLEIERRRADRAEERVDWLTRRANDAEARADEVQRQAEQEKERAEAAEAELKRLRRLLEQEPAPPKRSKKPGKKKR